MKTKISKKRVYKVSEAEMDTLSDQQRIFVAAYIGEWNGAKAAREAQYKHPEISACQLLKNPIIQRAVAYEMKQLLRAKGIDAADILFHLWCMATVSGDDFTDETGKIITNMKDLSVRAKACIAGIKQTVTTRTFDDGSSEETLTTDLKITDKGKAVEMAMKHKGLFEEAVRVMFGGTTGEGKAMIDWNALYGKPENATTPDIIEVKRLEEK